MPVLTPRVARRSGGGVHQILVLLAATPQETHGRSAGQGLAEATGRAVLSCSNWGASGSCGPASVRRKAERRTYHRPSAPAPDARSIGATSVSPSGLHSRDGGADCHAPDSTVATRRPGAFERPSLSLAPETTPSSRCRHQAVGGDRYPRALDRTLFRTQVYPR